MDAQTMGTLQQGIDLVGDFVSLANEPGNDNPYGPEAEAGARLAEQDAREEAWDRKQAARDEAADYRESAEKDRSGRRAEWGRSNLALSGSRQLVDRADRLKDRQEEDDILFQGDQDVRSALDRGRRRADMLRINNNADRTGTTLSLGSKLYRYGG
jgi:hypothetical protein